MRWPHRAYIREGRKQGRSQDLLLRAHRQAAKLQDKSLPAILTLNHLAWHTEERYAYLRSIVARRGDPYRLFWMTKRQGGKRLICIPERRLLNIQRWISQHVLSHIPAHHNSHAYSKGSRIVECARQHTPCQWLVKFDIRQFFESISERDVWHVFSAIGYRPLVAFELARICTREQPKSAKSKSRRWARNEHPRFAIRAYSSRSRTIGSLPQGAPTSPMLANLAVRDLDEDMREVSDELGLTYTRYADDLAFSTDDRHFGRANAERLVRIAFERLRSHGFVPHVTKTVIAPPGSRRVVLGLLVDKERPRLQREFRSRVRQHLYYLEKLGPVEHARNRGFRTMQAMRDHVAGLISFAQEVEPDLGGVLRERFDAIRW